MNNEYIVFSGIYSDNITFPTGKKISNIVGGAGGYALAGLRLWSDNVLIVSGVGKDYNTIFGDWLSKNQLDESGLEIVDNHSYQNDVVYETEESRTETPRYGINHREILELSANSLKKYVDNKTKAIYTFLEVFDEDLEIILDLKKENNFKVMWEIRHLSLYKKYLPKIKEYAKSIEMFSINYEEASKLFSEKNTDKLISLLKELGFEMCLFRLGSKGVVVITQNEHKFVKSVSYGTLVDVTGCGNASTAGAMFSYSKGEDLLNIGLSANISAAFVYQQYGPYSEYTKEARDEAIKLRNDLYMLERGNSNE